MTYDAHGQYGSDPRYPQGQYPPQYPQNPQYPQSPQSPQYPPTNPYPQTPAYPPPGDPYAQPGANDPTAPVVPSQPYGGGPNPYGGGGGSYGGNDPYGGQYGGGSAPPYGGGSAPPYGGSSPPYGGQYGADPYSAVPSSGWPAPGSVPPGGMPPDKPKTGMIVGLAAGAVVLVLVLGGVALAATRLLGDEDEPTDPPATVAGPGGEPSAEPPANSDPFADTPAASFASGEEGIELPEATAVGEFSADQVDDMLGQVRDALVATRLDDTMLVEHDPESFISAMAQDNQDSLRQAFSDGEFGYFASQFADGAELAVPEPRVQGTITFEATQDEGGFNVIEVVTKFVWAYAFVVPNDNPELDGVVVVRDELVWQVADPSEVDESSQGLWLWDGQGYASGIDCEQFDQSLLAPQAELSVGSGEGPSEGEVFDPEGSLDLPDTC
jgi:hypothetical protein